MVERRNGGHEGTGQETGDREAGGPSLTGYRAPRSGSQHLEVDGGGSDQQHRPQQHVPAAAPQLLQRDERHDHRES